MPKRTDIRKILLIGSGPIVIGQACEFDYSGTQACKALREEGFEIILVNSNPATIMTDPEMADATYIEPLTADILELIIKKERPHALLPTMGGQTALNLAVDLSERVVLDRYGVELIGAKLDAIKKAENRELFKEAMEKIGLEVPKSAYISSVKEGVEATEYIGFPAILRPSFTLGGTGGGIAYNIEEFKELVERGLKLSPIQQVLIEESVLGWKEYELEVMRDGKDNVVIICSIENFDPMGIHTGDSVTVAPAQTLTDKEYQRMRDAAIAVIREIGVDTGGSNIQFAHNPQNGRMVVIEMNPRVSRSSALASKATGFPIAKIAAKVMVGKTLKELGLTEERHMEHIAIKEAVFPFDRFPGVDTILGPEMKSTGEVMGIDEDFGRAFGKSQISCGNRIPLSGKIFISLKDKDKPTSVPIVKKLLELGLSVIATRGTAQYLKEHGLEVEVINKVTEGRPHIVDSIKNREIDFVINTVSSTQAQKDSFSIRRSALQYKVPFTTTISGAFAAAKAIEILKKKKVNVRSIQEYHKDLLATSVSLTRS